MSLFGKILEKLRFGASTAQAAAPPQSAPTTASSPAPAPTAAPPVVAMATVDVVAKLEGLAAANKEKLNWKVSIVDLMKLLGLDSRSTARKELATELGCPAAKMADAAQMNMWLHKTVLQKLAENGGTGMADTSDNRTLWSPRSSKTSAAFGHRSVGEKHGASSNETMESHAERTRRSSPDR